MSSDRSPHLPRSASLLLGWTRPFLGLVLIFTVFGIYDLTVFDAVDETVAIRSGPLTTLIEAFGGDGTEGLKAARLERFGGLTSWYNLKKIAAQTAVIAIGALGMTLVIISGGIDLSPGSSIALATVVIALLLRGFTLPFTTIEVPGVAPVFAALVGVLVAGGVGVTNGVLITRLRIVPFIVTLGMMSVARGAAKLLSGEQKVNVPARTWINDLLEIDAALDAPWWQVPAGFGLLVVLALALSAILRYTIFGRYVFAIGSNESTARLCGIRVEGQKTIIYAVAGLFVGLAAVLEFSLLNSGDPSTAVGRELDIIAAVVIGGASLSGGKGSVLGTLVGAFVIGVLRNGCVLFELPNPVQEIVVGAIIVTAAGLDRLQDRGRA